MTDAKRDKLMEGHRLIRNFQREREKEVDITDLKWKEIGIIKNQLSDIMKELRDEIEKNKDSVEKQMDIVDDMSMIKHFIYNCINMKIGMNNLIKKYGWDK